MRHLAVGGGVLRELNDLRGPMAAVLDFFVQQKQELDRYKQRYGELSDHDYTDDERVIEETEDSDEDID